jgi:hypothetical protein
VYSMIIIERSSNVLKCKSSIRRKLGTKRVERHHLRRVQHRHKSLKPHLHPCKFALSQLNPCPFPRIRILSLLLVSASHQEWLLCRPRWESQSVRHSLSSQVIRSDQRASLYRIFFFQFRIHVRPLRRSCPLFINAIAPPISDVDEHHSHLDLSESTSALRSRLLS